MKTILKTIRENIFTPWGLWLGFLGMFLVAALVAGLSVFWFGLSLTNLTDIVPWGLWITIDLSSIAVAAGAFSLCAIVYLFGFKRYEPIARTATFIGFTGYSMAMMALLLDIGRPDRFWKSFVYWNTHSLLWEVTMCVGLYFTVLVLEVLPIVASFDWLRKKFPRIAEKMEHLHHYAPVLAIFGLGLSSLHQSSLGAVYGVIKARPIWYRPEMSVMFMFTAILGGVALTLFASMLSARLTSKAKVNDILIERVSQVLGYMMIAYLYWRFWDWLAQTYTYEPGRTEAFELLTKGTLSFNFWFGEMLFGALIPTVILLYKPTRLSPFWRMLGLAMIVGGVVAFRFDTNIVGFLAVIPYLPGEAVISYTSYSPSLVEWAAGLGIIAFGLLAFSIGVKYLRVVDHRLTSEEYETV
ncbi:MAG TPA: polysulfide reductase NrfD, partial [Anaerolineales bacterium]|nr:polysulfide reductase NrfD [Anaerolineales bacterium]HMX20997.1 polysulfide reductase NrfD [Anaerolineales bacterium]HMZ44806.1 polysulfide reductase NrfD [Anaerolineales bacterium]HNB88371.1 polysulfide reductase NrfD [Anaerolineales bacterium]HNC90915.1 polysulfide reductase NrfD [Anaerolineales bacterium]